MKPAQLLVFVDALGPTQAPLLTEAGLHLGHSASLQGVLGYSSGAIPTILTGVSPAAHGRMCLFARAATESPLAPLRWLGLLPRVVHERGRVRRVAARVLAAALGYDGYFAIHRVPPELFAGLEVPEKDDLFEAADVGGAPTLFARARAEGLRVTLTDWRADERERVRKIEATPDADLAFLYLSGLDAILHRDGATSDAARRWARDAVGWIDRARSALARGGGGSREVRTIVVGDHGMAEITRTIDPRPLVRSLRAQNPNGFLFVDSTMLRVDAGASPEKTRALLASLPGEVLDSNALRARDVPSDGRYGDFIALLPEGTLFAPSFVGGRARGMHGYDRSSPSARAALLSDSPIDTSITRLEDIAPMLAGRLGLIDRVAA